MVMDFLRSFHFCGDERSVGHCRDQADPKFLHLHIHKDYYEIIRDNWLSGWKEANAKTKYPDYNCYVYIVKFAVLRSNEEYRTM